MNNDSILQALQKYSKNFDVALEGPERDIPPGWLIMEFAGLAINDFNNTNLEEEEWVQTSKGKEVCEIIYKFIQDSTTETAGLNFVKLIKELKSRGYSLEYVDDDGLVVDYELHLGALKYFSYTDLSSEEDLLEFIDEIKEYKQTLNKAKENDGYYRIIREWLDICKHSSLWSRT